MMKLAYCGDDCNYCPRYVGTINNNENELKKAAEIWYKVGWRDNILLPDEMKCFGCSSVKWCRYGMKECCEKKQIDNCGYCSEYPCEKLKEAFKTTKEFEEKSKTVLPKNEYDILKKAFYRKEEYLNRIKQENCSDQ